MTNEKASTGERKVKDIFREADDDRLAKIMSDFAADFYVAGMEAVIGLNVGIETKNDISMNFRSNIKLMLDLPASKLGLEEGER